MLGFIFLLNNFHSLETNMVTLISFIPIFILALISAVKRGWDSGLIGAIPNTGYSFFLYCIFMSILGMKI